MYKITFTPFTNNSNAQLITIATVVNTKTGEEYWSEPVVIDVVEGMDEARIADIIKQKTSGFGRRVEAIELAKTFEGLVPDPIIEV